MCITSRIGNDLLLEAQGCTAGYLCLFVVDVDDIESHNFFLKWCNIHPQQKPPPATPPPNIRLWLMDITTKVPKRLHSSMLG